MLRIRMGGGIAMCFIQKGVPVVLKDAKQDRDITT
jgi:3-hydroxyacyl-CoA dehydrogenase